MHFALLQCLIFLCFFPLLMVAQNNITVGSTLTAGSNSSWVSPSDDFAFGFQPVAAGGGFIVAIWFDKIPEKTVTWSANQGNLAQQGCKLQLTAGGLLLNDPSGTIIVKIAEGTHDQDYSAMQTDQRRMEAEFRKQASMLGGSEEASWGKERQTEQGVNLSPRPGTTAPADASSKPRLALSVMDRRSRPEFSEVSTETLKSRPGLSAVSAEILKSRPEHSVRNFPLVVSAETHKSWPEHPIRVLPRRPASSTATSLRPEWLTASGFLLTSSAGALHADSHRAKPEPAWLSPSNSSAAR